MLSACAPDPGVWLCLLGVPGQQPPRTPAEPCSMDAPWGTQPAPYTSWPHSLISSCFGTSLGTTVSPQLFPAVEMAALAEMLHPAPVQLLPALTSLQLEACCDHDTVPGCLARAVAIAWEAKASPCASVWGMPAQVGMHWGGNRMLRRGFPGENSFQCHC